MERWHPEVRQQSIELFPKMKKRKYGVWMFVNKEQAIP